MHRHGGFDLRMILARGVLCAHSPNRKKFDDPNTGFQASFICGDSTPACAPKGACSKTRCSYLVNRDFTCDENSNRILSSESNHKLHVLWGDPPVVWG